MASQDGGIGGVHRNEKNDEERQKTGHSEEDKRDKGRTTGDEGKLPNNFRRMGTSL